MRREVYKNTGGFVRITGGEFKGRKIRTPGGGTHPMGERERIALFNILGDRVRGSLVLDLYCGGGTLAIEALSRGAKSALGVDCSDDAVKVMTDNLRELGILDGAGKFKGAGVEEFSGIGAREFDNTGAGESGGAVLKGKIPTVFQDTTEKYSLILADPPYDKFDKKMVEFLPEILVNGGTLVVSHPGEPFQLNGLRLKDSRKYAGAHLSFYIKD